MCETFKCRLDDKYPLEIYGEYGTMRNCKCLEEAMKIPNMAEWMFKNGEMFCKWQIDQLKSEFLDKLSPALKEFVVGQSHQHLKRSKGRPPSSRADAVTVWRINILNYYAKYLGEEQARRSIKPRKAPSERAFNRVARRFRWNVQFGYAKNAISEWRTDPNVVHLSSLLKCHEK